MDVKTLQDSWKAMTSGKSMEEVGECLFSCLFSAAKGEEIRATYFPGVSAANTPEGRKHGSAVCTGIGKMLDIAGDKAKFDEAVKGFVAKHQERKVGAAQMDVMKVAFKDFLSKMGQSGTESHWIALLSLLSEKL